MTSPTRGAALLLLPLLAVAAFYCLWIVATNNGLFGQISSNLEQKQPMFPGSKSPLMLEYTGVAAIDRQMSTLVTFFGPLVTLGDEPLHLFSLFGLGQFGGAWTLLVMESLRRGNKGKAVSFVGTYGFFVQNLSFAISTPVYLFMHLLTSPTAKPYTATPAGSDLIVSTYDLAIIPISVTLGYIIPSLLMIFPGNVPIASPMHQYIIAFWQAFPLWTMLIQWILKPLCSLLLGQDTDAKTEKSSQTTVSGTYLNNASQVYIFVLALCMATYLPALLLSLLPPDTIPESIPALAYLARPSFASTFIPPLPLGQPIRHMAEGVHIFLLWDMYIGSVSGLLWAVVLYQNASLGKQSIASSLSLLVKSTIWTVLGGPVAAWTILTWERDQVVKQKVKV